MKRRYQGWLYQNQVVWCLVVAMLFAGSGSPSFIVYAQEANAEVEAQIANLEKLFDALEAAAKEIPRDTFDLEAALALTDLTPESILTWVRDNTYLVPYKGALRGSQGVLMDRVGNSLDRAMLLQGLLQLLGYDTQLARAQLSEVQAQDILNKTRPIPAEGALPQTADADLNTELQKYVSEFGLDGAQVTQALEQANQQRATLQAEMKTRVASQTEFLMNALGNPTGDMAAEKAKQVAALQDHWWVQYQEGGVWVDLDPTMPDAVPNQKILAASETLMASKLEELPLDLLHTLQIKVVLECALDSGLQETTLVESPLLIPANLLGQYFAVTHVPVNMPKNVGANDSTTLKNLVLEQDRWFPVITIGSQSLYDRDYTTSCEIGAASPPWLGTAVVGSLEEATDLLDTFGEETAAPTDERVTGQFIDYVLHIPGEADEVVRRQIFDMLGVAARANNMEQETPSEEDRLSWRLALFGETEILPLFSEFSSEFITGLVTERLLAQKNAILGVGRVSNPEELDALVAEAAKHAPLPSALYALALTRKGLDTDPYLYLDKLNIINRHSLMKPGTQNEITLLQSFDFVINDFAVSPSAEDAYGLRLEQGILDTNAETLIESSLCQSAGGAGFCTIIGNPADALAASQQASDWLIIRTEADLASQSLSWPEDALTRVKQDLMSGYTVVLPAQPPQGEDTDAISWWRIEASTGQSLGVNAKGWGVSASEWALLVNFVVFGFCEVGAVMSGAVIGGTLLCTLGFATGVGAIGAAPAAGVTGAAAASATNLAGALALASAILSGIGGLGYPKDPGR